MVYEIVQGSIRENEIYVLGFFYVRQKHAQTLDYPQNLGPWILLFDKS